MNGLFITFVDLGGKGNYIDVTPSKVGSNKWSERGVPVLGWFQGGGVEHLGDVFHHCWIRTFNLSYEPHHWRWNGTRWERSHCTFLGRYVVVKRRTRFHSPTARGRPCHVLRRIWQETGFLWRLGFRLVGAWSDDRCLTNRRSTIIFTSFTVARVTVCTLYSSSDTWTSLQRPLPLHRQHCGGMLPTSDTEESFYDHARLVPEIL